MFLFNGEMILTGSGIRKIEDESVAGQQREWDRESIFIGQCPKMKNSGGSHSMALGHKNECSTNNERNV